MKKILVLGTGAPQGDLMEECKRRGLDVYACSRNKGDMAEKIADGFCQIDIVDADAVEKYACEIGADLIYSVGSDVAMPTVFTVSKRLGLFSFCSPEIADICNHKTKLRDCLGKGFEGNLRHQRITSAKEKPEIFYPLMMKPTDSQGQRGVCRVNSYEDFLASFERSISFSREKAVILEEYAEGEEISVNTFSIDGKLLFFLPSDRITWSEYPGGIIHRHLLPGKQGSDPAVASRIRDLVDRTLKKIGILNGPAYFQIIVTKEGFPKLIEVTPRLDGCHMWRLINYSTGVNLMSLTVDLLLGNPVTVPENYEVKPYETEFLCMPPDSDFSNSTFDILGSEFLLWYYENGEKVHRMNGYMEKCGYCIKSR